MSGWLLALFLSQSQKHVFQSRITRGIGQSPQTLNVSHCHNLPVIDYGDPPRVRLGHVQVVGREDRRHATLCLVTYPVLHRDPSLRIQRRQRLIQNKNRGTVQTRSDQRYFLLHTLRQATDQTVTLLLQPEALERVGYLLVEKIICYSPNLSYKLKKLQCRKPSIEAGILRQISN